MERNTGELYCYRHPSRRAEAIIQQKYLVCHDCGTAFQIEVLNAGAMLGIAVKGEPVALLIPQEEYAPDNYISIN